MRFYQWDGIAEALVENNNIAFLKKVINMQHIHKVRQELELLFLFC